jgi:hypothetical protein
VPIDDYRHWKYTVIFHREQAIDRERFEEHMAREVDANYRLAASRANRYQQDRSKLPTHTYSGIPGFAAQDTWATESMGPIVDRTQEHLGQSDRVIIAMRQMLLEAVRDVADGKDPPHVIRDPAHNHFPSLLVWVGTVPSGTDWQAIRRRAAAAGEGALAPTT